MANLVLNAIRYTPQGGSVTVTGGQDADSTWLAVTDTCGGIADTDLPRIFEPAYRGGSVAASATPSPAASPRLVAEISPPSTSPAAAAST